MGGLTHCHTLRESVYIVIFKKEYFRRYKKKLVKNLVNLEKLTGAIHRRDGKVRYMSIHGGFAKGNAICVVMPSFPYQSFSQSTSITSYIFYLLSKLIVRTVLFVIQAENNFKRS